MAEKKNQFLKITLALLAIITLGYGIIYLFFPQIQISAAGGEPIEPGWIRWFGGILIALGMGSIMVLRNPEKQGIFVTVCCVGTLLFSLASFYEVIFVEFGDYNLLNTLIPAIVMTVMAILLWLSLRQSKEILW
jgi:hypothetical protein